MATFNNRIKKLEQLLNADDEFEFPGNIDKMKDSEINALFDRYLVFASKKRSMNSIISEFKKSGNLSNDDVKFISENSEMFMGFLPSCDLINNDKKKSSKSININ